MLKLVPLLDPVPEIVLRAIHRERTSKALAPPNLADFLADVIDFLLSNRILFVWIMLLPRPPIRALFYDAVHFTGKEVAQVKPVALFLAVLVEPHLFVAAMACLPFEQYISSNNTCL